MCNLATAAAVNNTARRSWNTFLYVYEYEL